MAAQKDGERVGGGDLASKKCAPCEGKVKPLGDEEIERLMPRLKGWKKKGTTIERLFEVDGYLKGVAFVNAVAWMAEHENHHPDIELGYKKCLVRYSTHAIGGLSENDFIAAAKVDALA